MRKLVSFLLVVTIVLIAGGCDFKGEGVQGKLFSTNTQTGANCPGTWTKIFQVKGNGTTATIVSGTSAEVINKINNGCDFKVKYGNDLTHTQDVYVFNCDSLNIMSSETSSSYKCDSGTYGSVTGEGPFIVSATFNYSEGEGVVGFILSSYVNLESENPSSNSIQNKGYATLYYR